MQFAIHITRIIIVSLIRLKIVEGANNSVADIVNYINKEGQTGTNVLVNLDEPTDNFREIAKAIVTPKLLIRNATTFGHVIPVYERFNKWSLTIVWLSKRSVNESLQLLDRLLWRIHFKDILLIYQQDAGAQSELNDTNLFPIFQKCFAKGFISVLLWTNQQLYTYHPYPTVKVVTLNSVAMFMDKSHLNNFQQYTCRMPFFDYPNLCFNYTNRQGKLIRTGYFYKWVAFYLEFYNASIDHFFHNLWRPDYKPVESKNYLKGNDYCLIPNFVGSEPDYFDRSNVPYLTRVILLVPNSKEIKASLYLTLPYSGLIFFIIVVSGGLFFALMFVIQRKRTEPTTDWSKLALQAFCAILFLSIGLRGRKTLTYFCLHLIFLFTGIFLTNYYASYLSSLSASKVYEPELRYLNDLAGTNLKILQHSYEEEEIKDLELPKVLNGRFLFTASADLATYRLILNMSYMFKIHDEAADFFLFQQQYLKHPTAKKLNEEMLTRPHFVTLPHRSPLIDHFNRYLMRILENGLMMKFVQDTMLDGIWSGFIKFMPDPQHRKPLTLEYFYYAFVIWLSGLFCALVSFLIELKVAKCNRTCDI